MTSFPVGVLKAIADEAQGENVLIVTHGDGVNASVTRIWPWAIAHPVLHTGFTVAMREKEEGVQRYKSLLRLHCCIIEMPTLPSSSSGSPTCSFTCTCAWLNHAVSPTVGKAGCGQVHKSVCSSQCRYLIAADTPAAAACDLSCRDT